MQHIIMITGAGKGIGRAIALAFAKAGKEQPSFEPVLVLSSRTESDLRSLAFECQAHGAETLCIQADIAVSEEREKLVKKAVEKYGTIDCLINNAGVGRFKPFGEMTEEDFDYTVATNLKGTFFLTQSVFRAMEKKKSGHIFFITSIAAEKAFKSSTIYSMSKFGQKGLLEALRLYAAESNIRITNVMPGAVFTPMWGEVSENMQALMMRPEDIAGPVVNTYLLPSRTTVEELVIRPVGGDINE
ncbi:SDR family oxidoreductase [Chlorobium phaeobacteroides]|uniref:Short-chain dehydrogenase/reductase SDR n=1 Tax=Chlorobium phaeobacteroides (strain DSM 266 / SMG 266 / 2430) TaxID=290317 RepID=A1BHA3_CHLPD|nr:SDR family oxidoreductase [Chlorobium phaeobacteroides]ABL65780.1 short-chain dehydrogenase/reductase SDR [Chlorobium phaeobacteroides DSM 266]